MWLVPHMTSGKTSRHVIPPEARAALVRWYTGEGSDADHRASMTLVTGARERHLWFACDCLGDDERPPLLSPAYLSEAETYYLRRLTSSHRLRPEHRDDCPFFREQSAPRLREKLRPEAREIDEIDQFFLAHRLAPEKLAQRPDEAEVDDRARGVAIPRLARLLWMLMDRASLNRIPFLPESGDEPPLDLGKGFALVKRHAEPLEVAPGVPLAPHLYTHVEPFERLQLHARLRQAARTWPEGFAPQAFMLLYTENFSGNTLQLAQGHELEFNTRIQYLGLKREEGPPISRSFSSAKPIPRMVTAHCAGLCSQSWPPRACSRSSATATARSSRRSPDGASTCASSASHSALRGRCSTRSRRRGRCAPISSAISTNPPGISRRGLHSISRLTPTIRVTARQWTPAR